MAYKRRHLTAVRKPCCPGSEVGLLVHRAGPVGGTVKAADVGGPSIERSRSAAASSNRDQRGRFHQSGATDHCRFSCRMRPDVQATENTMQPCRYVGDIPNEHSRP